jgi:glycosyltransferase involved in cell wall biosynthesis
MNEPLVSVLIPVYNHARYVRQCLDSLLTEGWPNLEVLIIDDGSTDDSFEVVQAWRAEHPGAFARFDLTKQENLGITRTLNRLVAKASGEFITLVASDDSLLREGIKKRLELLLSNTSLLGVIGDSHLMNDESHVYHESGTVGYAGRGTEVFRSSKSMALELIIRWWMPGPILLLRKDAFDSITGVGLYDETLSFEDRDFYLRLLARRALGFVPFPVANYRFVPGMTKYSDDRFASLIADEASVDRKHYNKFQGVERGALFLRGQFLSSRAVPKWKLRRIFWTALWRILERFYGHYAACKYPAARQTVVNQASVVVDRKRHGYLAPGNISSKSRKW